MASCRWIRVRMVEHAINAAPEAAIFHHSGVI
jgi:hypothetical protein